mmetsp:Transcript_17183/g.35366  ORF Transcript_17183/g.35366 Transcript_17183/m.35366 type:complete len:147 (+) Transcript_17183:181-621(+)|eukprot:CAMPEP_0118656902 /NCGR_PEP_ID=MMETSP0785-20121206/13727_1 /TAXON_ID=91992 /ORGANISM="Bolidomonas pacifica, Strain CCMP 1866" /LENGTH=146 /DNA_ID=CAMNT_0006549773 /DNA_START=135 /DNA_END=575 /DNA_ORIENTATION=-
MNYDAVHISGYLHKMTRDGRWQKRWFETNGNFLTYYKSKKMTKLLAALNLPQVGEIKAIEKGKTIEATVKGEAKSVEAGVEDNDGSFFTIELNERIYTLKADNQKESLRWVATLNALKAGGQNEERKDQLADVEKTQRGGCMGCCV